MLKVWRRRRQTGTAPPKKPIKPVDPARSEAMKKSWRRRWRAGTAPKKQKRVLLSPAERSEIAKAAAALRVKRVRRMLRREGRRLGLSRTATPAEIRLALRKEAEAAWQQKVRRKRAALRRRSRKH